jgi:hypothetical protein
MMDHRVKPGDDAVALVRLLDRDSLERTAVAASGASHIVRTIGAFCANVGNHRTGHIFCRPILSALQHDFDRHERSGELKLIVLSIVEYAEARLLLRSGLIVGALCHPAAATGALLLARWWSCGGRRAQARAPVSRTQVAQLDGRRSRKSHVRKCHLRPPLPTAGHGLFARLMSNDNQDQVSQVTLGD